MRLKTVMYLGLIGFLSTQCTVFDNKDQLSSGEALYLEHCSGCHGEKAVGGDPKQPDGYWADDNRHIAPALNGDAHAWHHPPELFFQKVKHGLTDEKSTMPVYGDVVSDEEIRMMFNYVKYLWPEEMRNTYKERYDDSKLFDI